MHFWYDQFRLFKFVDLKSGQLNSNISFENNPFLSHRPPQFLVCVLYLKSGQPNSNSFFENRHFCDNVPLIFKNVDLIERNGFLTI